LHHGPHGRIIMTEVIDQAYTAEPGESAGSFEM